MSVEILKPELATLSVPAATCPEKFNGVVGYEERSNDVLYFPPLQENAKPSALIYFGGDIQDFHERMASEEENKNYLNWSLENTARILRTNFSDCHIIVVRPSRMEHNTFSCYDNFVPTTNYGVPEHVPMHHALKHLEMLLESVSKILLSRKMLPTIPLQTKSGSSATSLAESMESDNPNNTLNPIIELPKCDLKLVGFSKGCVVLNQILFELHYLETRSHSLNIVNKIKEIYWLDGGHSGKKNTWITSRPLLSTFSKLGIGVHIHVTPYQIEDNNRPWLQREEKDFYDILCTLNAPVSRVVHYENLPRSIELHFMILTVFHQPHSRNGQETGFCIK